MRRIDTTQIIDPNVEQPFGGPSIDFLTQNELETLQALALSLIGDSYSATQVYVLWGCVVIGVTSGAGNFAMTAGAIFYGGEIYQVAAVSTISVGTGNTVYSLLSSSPTTVDPVDNTRVLDAVTFSDGSSKNVHLTRTWITSIQVTGTGGFANPVSGWITFNTQAVAYGNAVAYGSGYTNTSGSTFLYYCVKANVLYINGVFSATSATLTNPIITLPAFYRPKFQALGVGQVTDPSGTIAQFTMVWFKFDTSGRLLVTGFGGSTTNNFILSMAIPLS